ncbi:thiamine-phosphate kinase [Vibrio aphrogenes]|uniref:thiamine-phosphate kinase n=1 Tax=Vibrio aphrogenes TaxID=1891186 RepID=UPI000B359530|nr:thiamine-phosphate kinase [Vibrio aphrogenes]
MSGEFNLIEKYFAHKQANRPDVDISLGDDCALISPPEGYQIAISTDTVVLGTHFLADADPAAVAYKALMSNISDLAAMGATPAWFSMALTLPEINESWLTPFCHAMFTLADEHQLQLIGGDTTKGPLSISFTIQGLVPTGKALTRGGANLGDAIYVTGNLGDSHAGLSVILQPQRNTKPYATELVKRHFYAQSRIRVAEKLRGIATSCIDISDGLIADLGHILKRSKVAAQIDVALLPLSKEVIAFYGEVQQAQHAALQSGEEYELCFTVPVAHQAQVETLAQQSGCTLTCIGQIVEQSPDESSRITLLRASHPLLANDPILLAQGFDHFN